jgi:putative peptidoglycan lipid II flippase
MTIEPTAGDDAHTVPPSNLMPQPAAPETSQIARTASIISLGNIASRVLGLVRESVKSHFFGAGATVDAYNIAVYVPVMLYDLIIGGMVNSSLVPVFSEYAQKRREELWEIVSILLSLLVITLAIFILMVELIPAQVAMLISRDSAPEVIDLAARLLRVTVPAVLFLSISGVLTGLLFALKRFTLPAFTAAVFNAGIVVTAMALQQRLGVTAMALGLLLGAIGQVILQLAGLRDARLRFNLNLRHPALKRILLLFMPIALGLVVDILINRLISYNLASKTGEGGISWMQYATTLVQLPQGLVAIAVSFAVLPLLSVQALNERADDFRATLARGLRLVLVLIIPAAIGLFILARPTVALIFEHGDFLAHDTDITTQALQLYLLGLPFAAVDLLLVFAFYARQDTWTPSLIGVVTVIINLAIAIILLPTLGLYSLMIADSVKQFTHALISWVLLRRRLGNLAEHAITRTLLMALLASAVMGLVTYGTLGGIQSIAAGNTLVIKALVVGVPGLLGAAVYLGLITVLRVEEINLLWSAVRRRLSI